MADKDNGAAESTQQLQVEKLYLKDASFESPNSPAMFTEDWKPKVHFELNTQTNTLDTDLYDVVLSVSAEVKQDNKTAFLVEVQQAGIFRAVGFSDEELGGLLGSYCPNMLYPYAREVVSDLVVKGGFPPLILAPVNFDALYAQHVAAQQEKQA